MRKNYKTFGKNFLLLLAFVIASGSIYAQLAMTRSVFTAAYTPISVIGGATATTIAGDDGTQTLIPIGFTFNYLGTNYTTVDGCANGWISFGAAGANAWTNTNLWTATTPNLTVAAWWDDLNVGTGSVLYQTQGVVGSRTFTVQWTDVLSYNGAVRTLNFQTILYEGTNVIEFRYGNIGPVAGFSTSESASIGIEGATGGAGNFLDCASGSAFINQSYLTTHKWPAANIRLTPGAPTALPGGTYTVGVAGTFPNLSEAVAAVNHRGISGAVTLSLIDAVYDTTLAGGSNTFPIMLGPVTGNSAVNTITIQPASGTSTLSYRGVVSGSGGNQTNSTAYGTTSEPILAVVGTDYVTARNLNLVSTGSTVSNLVDRGLLVANATATNGSTNGLYENLSVTLLRNNASSIGIQQIVSTAATNATGANSNNIYRNLSVSNVYAGIYLLGTAGFPDLACQVGNTSPTAFNTIGGATAFDIGNGTTATQNYGIRVSAQNGVKVFNNAVTNVSATTTTDGILCENGQGICEIYMNKVTAVRNNSTSSTASACGIRANTYTTTTGHSVRVYNNFVSDISSAYTGAATATRIVKGIYVQSAGGGALTETINVNANNVRIDGTLFPNASNACFEIGTATGPVMSIRNNVFSNFTGAQAGVATHSAWFSTSATSTGNTGSVSNYNDLYVSNATNGFTGTGAATTYATLANWQAGMVGQDVNSIATDPNYLGTSDLHVTSSSLNSTGNLTASAWVTVDIDNLARSVTPDIGADEFTPSTIDMQAQALTTPATSGCHTATEAVSVTVKNNAPITIDFSVNPTTVTVNVTGAITQTLTVTLNSGTLAAGASQLVAMGNINMSGAGTYTFNGNTSVTGDGIPSNDAFAAVNILVSGGTALGARSGMCQGDSALFTASGYTNGGTVQWQSSPDNLTWTNIPGATATTYMSNAATTTYYRAVICGLHNSVSDTITVFSVAAPTTQGDTICGTGNANLSASGSATLNWFDQMVGGTMVNTGSTYSPLVASTTTFYVENSSGTQAGLHTTTYAAGNGSSGNVFTIKALNTITITNFDGHTSTTANGNWEIWYRPNDYLLTPGSENSNVGWTQLGAATNVPQLGTGLVTPIPIYFSLTIPAGQTYSFEVFNNGGVNYTNGTLLGAIYNANADLEFYQGKGGTGFAMPNSPRVFNGRIHYTSGCTSPRVAVTATVTPADTIAITASSMISCSGDSVTLTAASINTGYNYTWTPNGTLSTGTGNTVSAGPTMSTSYFVEGIDSVGCSARDTIDIAYINKPTVTATVAPDTICAGDSIALSSSVAAINFQVGTGTIANGATSYPSPFGNFYWGSRHQMLILASELQAMNLGAGYINSMSFDVTNLNGAQSHDNFEIKMGLTAATSINTFQAPAFTSVFFAATYLPALGVSQIPFTTNFYWDGISNIIVETCHNNGSYVNNISVNQTTTPFSSSVWFRQDAAGVCANATVTGAITQRPNMYFTMAGTYSYDWTPNATLATPTAPNTVGTAPASTDFILMVTDSLSGCVGVDTASVFANPVPVINLGPDGYFCGTSTTLDAGNPGASYNWSTLDSTQTIFVSTSGSYSVDVLDTLGCSNSDTVAITFTPSPVINLGPDVSFCAGGSAVLDAGLTPATYLWTTLDSTQTITVNAAGTYGVEVTDTFGCSGSDSVNVTVNALPNVGLTLAVDSLCTVSPAQALTGGTPAGGTYSGTGVSGGSFNPATAGVGTHTITYSFTDGNGCSNTDTDFIVVTICVGITDAFNAFPLGLYPNPNTGRFTFTVPMDVTGEVRYEVADARGVVVMREVSEQPSGVYKQEVSLHDFATGMYTLRVTVDGKVAQKRFVVQR